MTDALALAFLDAVGATTHDAPPGWSASLSAAIHAARTSSPALSISDEELARGLARHAPPQAWDSWLSSLELPDLCLAIACAAGDVEALRRFESLHTAELRRLVHRFERGPLSADDIVQLVYERVLVHTPDRPARILEYSGRGLLKNWLRVTSLRLAIDLTRSTSGDDEVLAFAPERIFDAAQPGADPELDLLKLRYRADFKVAIHAAIKALPAYERNLLRQQLLGRMSIDQLAALYHIHRSTAARHLAHARELLLKETRRALTASLEIPHEDFDSIMALIVSDLDVSLSRALRELSEDSDANP